MTGIRPLSTVTGRFDYPPAAPSHWQNSDSFGDIRFRLRHIHQRLVEERQDRRAAAESASFERRRHLETFPMPSSNNIRRPRTTPRNTTAPNTIESAASEGRATSSNAVSSTANRNRPRATPSGRFNRSHNRNRQESENTLSGGLQGLEQAGERLAQISSNIEEILDRTNSPNSSSLPRDAPAEADNHQHRAKRRKLDSAKSDEFTNYKYGWFGQVEPTRLRMEIASCDGGSYVGDSGSGSGSTPHRPENVLKNDKSVYCTKRSKCDIVLRHEGETPFSIEKIMIKAPDRNFDAPVQEGMVFIAMTFEEVQNLLRRTADYTIDHVALRMGTASSPPTSSQTREQLTLQESLHDPFVSEATRRRNHDDIPPHALRMPTRERRFPTVEDVDDITENCDPPLEDGNTLTGHTMARTSAGSPTVYFDSDDDWSESEGMSPDYLGDRLRQEGRWPPTTEEDEAFQYRVIREWREAHRQARNGSRARFRRSESAAGVETANSMQRSTEKPAAVSQDEMVVPHGVFRMQHGCHRVPMKFDPPLSGRYILIKLWSPTPGANIDIQSIAVFGYSGPRFTPACETR